MHSRRPAIRWPMAAHNSSVTRRRGAHVVHDTPHDRSSTHARETVAASATARMSQAASTAVQQVIAGLSAPRRRRRYRDRMQATLERDPLVCPRCGAALWLWRLWHPRYGILYDAWERLKQRGGYAPPERSPGPAPGRDRTGDARAGPGGHGQLALFPLPT